MSDRATNKARTIKVRAGWYKRGDVNLVACGGYELRPLQPARSTILDWIATTDDEFARAVLVNGIRVSASDDRILSTHNTLRSLRRLLEDTP